MSKFEDVDRSQKYALLTGVYVYIDVSVKVRMFMCILMYQ